MHRNSNMDAGDQCNAEMMPNPLHFFVSHIPESDKCAPENKMLKTKVAKKKRGNLPKEAVAHLTEWLIRHIYNPYPSEETKAQLARETNLSIAQISYWFINARRRVYPKLLKEAGLDPEKFLKDKKKNVLRYRRPNTGSGMHVPRLRGVSAQLESEEETSYVESTCHYKVSRKREIKESSKTESTKLHQSIRERLKLLPQNNLSILCTVVDLLSV